MALPNSFVDLSMASEAPVSSMLSVIGVIVDILEPRVTSSGEYMLTFKLIDSKIYDPIRGAPGVTVRFFKKDYKQLPKVAHRGEIVLLRNIKMSNFKGQPILISNMQTTALVFEAASIPEPGFQIAFNGQRRLDCLGEPRDIARLSLEEQAYIIQLKEVVHGFVQALPSSGGNGLQGTPTSVPKQTEASGTKKRAGQPLPPVAPKKSRQSSFGYKFKLIEELRHFIFADICAQVVKKFTTSYGGCELYVSDYTENKDMFLYVDPNGDIEGGRDGDPYDYNNGRKKAWPGPYGQLVLKVNVKDPHASYANAEVNEGDFVLLQNVKGKAMENSCGKLEGDMWRDSLNPEKIQISKLNPQNYHEIEAILGRKEKYWASRAPMRPSNEQNVSSKAPKKRKKRHKNTANRAAGGIGCDQSDTTSSIRNKSNVLTNGGTKLAVNPHVRCSHDEVPLSSIKDILDRNNDNHMNVMSDGATYALPFINARYRARVKVVDFAPKQLEDFASLEPPDDEARSEISIDECDQESSLKYQWSFALLLQDASKNSPAEDAEQRIWVNLGHKEAQYLLGNNVNDPKDLRSDPRLLSKLREKMCILWGNLEENERDGALSNVPFECCLMEYGVEMDDDDPNKPLSICGYWRMHRMFGVTIL